MTTSENTPSVLDSGRAISATSSGLVYCRAVGDLVLSGMLIR